VIGQDLLTDALDVLDAAFAAEAPHAERSTALAYAPG
jgi:hypothetical protein